MIRQIKNKIFIAALAIIILFNYNLVLADKAEYTVKFHSQGGSVVNTQVVQNGSTVDEPKNPTKENNKFIGWYEDTDYKNPYLFSKPVENDKVFYAKLAKYLDITYVLYDTKKYVYKEIEGDTLKQPEDPTRQGYKFIGWYDSSKYEKKFEFGGKIEKEITIYAKWEKNDSNTNYTVKFDSKGGGNISNQTVKPGEKVSKPSNPIQKNYKFIGWYKENELKTEYNFNDEVRSNFTLYAKWEKETTSTNGKDKDKDKDKTYKIDFDTDGGTDIDRVKVKHGDKLKKPKDPYKAGYIFDGWYTSSKFRSSDEYDFSEPVEDDFKLYADWKNDKDTTEIDFVVYGNNRNRIEEERDYVIGKDETIMKVSEGVFNKKNKYTDKEKTKEDKARDKRNQTEFKKKGNTFISIDGIDNTKDFKWQVSVNDRLIEEKEIEKFELRYGDRIKWSYDFIYPGSQPTEPIVSKKSKGKYISGYSDKTFRPENYISREEVASVIHKLIDKKEFKDLDEKTIWFYDVEPGRWSESDISDLAKLGVMKGYGDKNFRPRAYISRGEVAVILSRINGLQSNNNDIFLDTPNHWGRMEINAVADEGWIRGYKDRTFKPNNFITRAEFVSMINSSLGLKRGKSTKKSPFIDVYPSKWYYHEILMAV